MSSYQSCVVHAGTDCLSQNCLCLRQQKQIVQHIQQKPEQNFNRNRSKQQYSQNDSESDSSEVSLDEDILESHEKALSQQIKAFSFWFYNQIVSENNSIAIKIRSFDDAIHQIVSKIPATSAKTLKEFQFYLFRTKTFKQFLMHIYYCYPEKIANELLRFAFFVWKLYLPFSGLIFNFQEIQSIAQKISEMMVGNQRLGKSSRKLTEGPKEVQQFISFYSLSIILVVQGVFKNPYSQPQSQFNKKRSLSSFQAQQYINQQAKDLMFQCKKLIKTQKS